MDMLKINESLTTDESIEEYEPITGSNLNNPGEIRITIQTQDIFYHPSESYLLFEGQLVKADGTAYANTDVVTITNNGIVGPLFCHLLFPPFCLTLLYLQLP